MHRGPVPGRQPAGRAAVAGPQVQHPGAWLTPATSAIRVTVRALATEISSSGSSYTPTWMSSPPQTRA